MLAIIVVFARINKITDVEMVEYEYDNFFTKSILRLTKWIKMGKIVDLEQGFPMDMVIFTNVIQ